MAISKDAVATTANLTAANTTEGAGVKTVSVMQSTDIGVAVSGTFTATVTFEGTLDGTNWFAVPAVKSDGTQANNTTAPGVFQASVRGLKSFRAHCTAYTSGTAAVALLRSAESGLF
jgi:hypothetical protein